MSYYEEYLAREKEKRNAEWEKNSWSIPTDNGETGEAVKKYYRKNGYA